MDTTDSNSRILEFFRGLKPWQLSLLFLLFGGLFCLDVVIPDPIPFVDEILLGLLTLLTAGLQIRNSVSPQKPPTKNVTPPPPGSD